MKQDRFRVVLLAVGVMALGWVGIGCRYEEKGAADFSEAYFVEGSAAVRMCAEESGEVILERGAGREGPWEAVGKFDLVGGMCREEAVPAGCQGAWVRMKVPRGVGAEVEFVSLINKEEKEKTK